MHDAPNSSEAILEEGVQFIAMADATVTLARGAAASGQTQLRSNILIVNPQSSGNSEALLFPSAANIRGPYTVVNIGTKAIAVQNSAGVLKLYIPAGEVGIVVSNGSAIYGYLAPQADRPSYTNRIGERFALRWIAGQRGKPSLNADIQNAAEGTRMIADPDFEVIGTNMTSALCTFNAEGGITLTTAGADGDEAILQPHQDANQTAWKQVTWGTDQETVWECLLKTGANITNAIIWAGLKLTSAEAKGTDNDAVYVRYEDDVSGGVWEVEDSIGGVDVVTNTGLAVAVSTKYRIKIVIGADRIARVYINGALVRTTAALTNATDLIPYIGVAADGAAAAKAITIYGQDISRTAG